MAISAPIIIAAAGVGVSAYSAREAKMNKPKLPALPEKAPLLADQAPLDLQAARRRRSAAGQSSTLLTSPQGVPAAGKTLLGA